MALLDLINSWFGPVAGIAIGRFLPYQAAYKLADFITTWIARDEDSELMQVLQHNQRLVQGDDVDDDDILRSARTLLRNVGRGYADWYKALYASTDEIIERCDIDDNVFEVIEQSRQDQRGLIFVGPHMSSFNMFLLGLGARKVDGQVLSYAQPRAGYQIDNAIRRRFGLDITPISIGSLRKAMANLRTGGFVLTAVDRPDVGGEVMTFFGRQMRLPVGHARLAAKTGARMLVGTCQKVREGHYHVMAESIETREQGDGKKPGALEVAQQALALLEMYIKERPEEWMMFLPLMEQSGMSAD